MENGAHPTQPELKASYERFAKGDPSAAAELVSLLYDELRSIAHRLMKNERPGHTLQTTALVNEAYLRLEKQRDLQVANRTHFLAIAARVMRRVLVDHARGRLAQKRGQGIIHVELQEQLVYSDAQADQLLAVEMVLGELEQVDRRAAICFELNYFGGLTIDESTESLPSLCPELLPKPKPGEPPSIAARTVKRDLQFARAFIKRQLGLERSGTQQVERN